MQKWAEKGVGNPGSAWLTGFGFDPPILMLRGIHKNEIGKSREAIDREPERIRPLLGKPGYIPAPDHLIPPRCPFRTTPTL